MKRLFIAFDIELSEDFKALSHQLQYELRNEKIVWVKRGLQHLTLRFLGETPTSQIEPIANILSNLADATPCFELQLDKMGIFGSKYAPETLWYGFNEFSLFKKLFENLEKKLIAIGIERNYGNFVPHVTVGRIKEVDNKKRFGETIEKLQPTFSQSIPVNSIKLIQSKLNRDGPEYKTLKNYNLHLTPLTPFNSF